jgi:type II secretory pathway component GspD/PulD (secretin)
MMLSVVSGAGLYAQDKPESAETKASSADTSPKVLQTFYLTNLTKDSEALDIMTDVRNMLPKVRTYYVPSQSALTVLGTQDDILLAQKIISELDKTKKLYRLTYTITENDSGKLIGTQKFSVIVVSGGKTDVKQGSRVPIVTGSYNTAAPQEANTQVQYVDVGLEIEASLDGYFDGVRLRTKVVQSSVVDEKEGVGAQDPVIRQTSLEGTSLLTPGKPLVLGSLDIPGSTRHQDVEVVSELVR